MNRFKKWLIPVAIVCLLLATLIGCSSAPVSLGEIFDPSGNPFANRFSDVKDIRAATFVVAASDSEHKYEADYFCNGTNDHVQIQAAIDALPATGGEVLLLDGTYNIEVVLTMDSYQTLRGCGRNTIFTTTTANTDIITATGGAGTEKVGILIADLCIDGDAGAATNDLGILFTYVDYSKVTNCWLQDNGESGIFLVTSDHNRIEGCTFIDNQDHQIELNASLYNQIAGNWVTATHGSSVDALHLINSDYNNLTGNIVYNVPNACGILLTTSDHNTLTGNTTYLADDSGIQVYESVGNTISGNTCNTGYAEGIYVVWNSHNTTVTGNTCNSNTTGIIVDSSIGVAVDGNACNENTYSGIELNGATYSSFVGNTCYKNGRHGIWIRNSSHHNTIVGNTYNTNSQTTDITYDNIMLDNSDDNLVEANLCRIGVEANGPRYGINVSNATCERNLIRNNDLYSSGKTAAFNDAGTDTELPSITVPFSDGSDIQDSGYLIDLAGEFANAWVFLNKDVVQVVRIKVYARAVPAEADKMRAEFVIYGGADNEAYTTHNGSVANHPSTSSNFAADDVIYWTITEAGVLALVGGDSVEIKVLHEAVGNGDIDTQAYLRTVTIEYV